MWRFRYSHAAHFTLKCGRSLSHDSYQLPVVALVCNFAQGEGGACLLSHGEVETLFHEFGHALHSLLSRTDYQHLAGTRAALDYVGTPSNLFEYFAWDPHFLHRFAGVPLALVASMRRAKAMFAATDLQSQVVYAMSDQALFGPNPPTGRETEAVLRDIQNEHSTVRHVEGTHWQTRFSHLVGYGAGYYTYLYARCFAASIWQTHLAEDPLNAQAGAKLRDGMLRWGGAKDPAHLLHGMGATRGDTGTPCADDLFREMEERWQGS